MSKTVECPLCGCDATISIAQGRRCVGCRMVVAEARNKALEAELAVVKKNHMIASVRSRELEDSKVGLENERDHLLMKYNIETRSRETVRARLGKANTLLRELEWIRIRDTKNNKWQTICPCCKEFSPQHSTNRNGRNLHCRLAAHLKGVTK